MKTDIKTPADVRRMVEGFYERVLKDSELAPIFLDVARIDIKHHIPRICAFYEKLLLGMPGYGRHVMNLHRAVNAAYPLRSQHFERWLSLFEDNVDTLYEGENTERVKRLVHAIADNMQKAMPARPSLH